MFGCSSDDSLNVFQTYYCLGTDNISLGNYKAATPHFPIKYRQAAPHGKAADADVVIFWRTPPGVIGPVWELVFAQDDLQIFRRRAP
jgi:hypothetical protein